MGRIRKISVINFGVRLNTSTVEVNINFDYLADTINHGQIQFHNIDG